MFIFFIIIGGQASWWKSASSTLKQNQVGTSKRDVGCLCGGHGGHVGHDSHDGHSGLGGGHGGHGSHGGVYQGGGNDNKDGGGDGDPRYGVGGRP